MSSNTGYMDERQYSAYRLRVALGHVSKPLSELSEEGKANPEVSSPKEPQS